MEENKEMDPSAVPDNESNETSAPESTRPAKKKRARKRTRKAAAKTAPRAAPRVERQGDSVATVCVRCWDAVLDRTSGLLAVDRFTSLSTLANRLGNWAVLVSSVLALLLGLILAIKMEAIQPLLTAIGFLLALSVLHYSAVKFIPTGKALIEASPSQVSTDAFPKSIALISLVGALVVLFGGIATAFQLESLNVFLQSVPGFFILLFLFWLAIHPELTHTRVKPTDSPGEEAISVVSFFMKAALRMVPILFGVLSVWGGVVLFVALVRSFGSDFGAMKGMTTGLYGGMLLLWGAGLPFATYLAYILYHLLIDVIRSILKIPER